MYELCRCIIEYINSINELPALFTDWIGAPLKGIKEFSNVFLVKFVKPVYITCIYV